FMMESFVNSWGRDDVILEEIHTERFSEPESLCLWLFAVSRSRPNSLVLDVGAYSGLFSLLSAASRSDIRSIAFEPSVATYALLLSNVTWNYMDLRVVPANLAVSHQRTDVILSHQYGIYTMSPGDGIAGATDADHTQYISAVHLDALLKPREQR